MPRKCCICSASKSVKYNEVPSDPALREKWLAVIPNKDNLGENPVVCNRHFQTTDYEPHFKVRRLKRGVIPMVIPHEEMQFEPYKEDGQKERYLDFFGTQIKEKNLELQEAKAKLQKVEGFVKTVTRTGGSLEKQLETVLSQLECLKDENKQKSLKIQCLENDVKELKATCHSRETDIKSKEQLLQQWREKVTQLENLIKIPKKPLGLCQEVPLRNSVETSVEVGGGQKELVSFARKKALKTKDLSYVERIQKLKRRCDLLVLEKRELEENIYYKSLRDMMINMNVDRKASFLLDQLKLYNKKTPRYSDVTLQECIIWEDADPKGYQYVRDSNLLTLPAQWTIKKHLGPMDLEQDDGNTSGVHTIDDQTNLSQ